MKYFPKFTIFLILLSGCSFWENEHKYFRRYIQEFESDFNTEVGTRFEFATSRNVFLDENKGGHCLPIPDKVLIKEKTWRQNTYGQKWALVYHELGHCHYGLDHFNATESVPVNAENNVDLNIVCPVSLMHKGRFGPRCYQSRTRRKMYVDRMWQLPKVNR